LSRKTLRILTGDFNPPAGKAIQADNLRNRIGVWLVK